MKSKPVTPVPERPRRKRVSPREVDEIGAHHEAGHACIASVLGVPFRNVRLLRPDDPGGADVFGTIEILSPAWVFPQASLIQREPAFSPAHRRLWWFTEDSVMVMLAGEISSEAVLPEDAGGPNESFSDGPPKRA